jgi:hypothetical protein
MSVQKLPSVSQQSNSVTLTSDADGRKRLTNLLMQCFDALKLYGKEPEQLGNLNAMFQLVLEDYSIEQITAAFKFYISRNTEIPAPADIVNIIRRGNKPPFDKAMYVQLSQKRERTKFTANGRSYDCLTVAEGDYMREYEEFQING